MFDSVRAIDGSRNPIQPVMYPHYLDTIGRVDSFSQDVSRWRLQFDGHSSVTNFLDRVEELRISRRVSKEQLLRSATELFSKDALYWLRTQNFRTWDELVRKLREDFLPYDYEVDLWEEIRKRTQGSKEKVVMYVAIMENLFNKLGSSKPKEETRVELIRRNFSIQSQLALHIHSIPELVHLARSVEETACRVQKFLPPPITGHYLNRSSPTTSLDSHRKQAH
nr:unnamed protein product [Callosobruchus analis]